MKPKLVLTGRKHSTGYVELSSILRIWNPEMDENRWYLVGDRWYEYRVQHRTNEIRFVDGPRCRHGFFNICEICANTSAK